MKKRLHHNSRCIEVVPRETRQNTPRRRSTATAELPVRVGQRSLLGVNRSAVINS